MNKLISFFTLFGLIGLATSCNHLHDDDYHYSNHGGHHGSTVNMPASVQTFISGSYPGYQIDEVYKEDICDDVPVYEVELEDGPGPDIDLYFDLNWTFLFRASRIAKASLPAPVFSTIQAQFPGYVIIPDSAERYDFPDGSVQYKVELEQNDDDDWEVVLTAGGNIVCAELD